jgi:apolipoprotein N-acyltransferase
LFYLAFPPVNLWPLIWVAAVPYLIAQHRLMPRNWAALAPAITFTIWLWPFLMHVFDIPEAPFWYKHMGLFFGILTYFMSGERKFHELTGYRWFILQGIFAWVGFEMIRSFIPFMGTLGFLANTQASQAWLLQPIAIFSIYGLNLLIILTNYALAQWGFHLFDRRWQLEDATLVEGKTTGRWLAIGGASLAVWLVISLILFNIDPKESQTVRLAALQPNFLEPGQADDAALATERLEVFKQQSREAAAKGAKVIFTHEMGFGYDPQVVNTEDFRALAAETGAYYYLSYGIWDEPTGWHNETVLLSPSGEFSEVYGKLHPAGEPPIVTAGTFPVNDTPYGNLASVICMDGNFTDATRNLARNDAELIGIPTFNSTVGIAEQNWTHFVLRSVENQVPIVNADKAYVSMVTDSHGKILTRVDTLEGGREILMADVAVGRSFTLHPILGDWLGWISLGAFIFFMVFQSITEKRAKNAEKS